MLNQRSSLVYSTVALAFSLTGFGTAFGASDSPVPMGALLKCQQADASSTSTSVNFVFNLQPGTDGFHCHVPGANDDCNMSGIGEAQIGAPYNVTNQIDIPLYGNSFNDGTVVIETDIQVFPGGNDTRAPLVGALISLSADRATADLSILNADGSRQSIALACSPQS